MLSSAVDRMDCKGTTPGSPTNLKPFIYDTIDFSCDFSGVTQHPVWKCSCIICAVHLLMSCCYVKTLLYLAQWALLMAQTAIVFCPWNVQHNSWGPPDASAHVWTNALYKYPSFCSLIGWPWWRWKCCKFSWVIEHLYYVDQGSSAFLLLNDFHVVFPFWLHKQEQLWADWVWLVKRSTGKG